jgi:carboxyl-terminal processing protease
MLRPPPLNTRRADPSAGVALRLLVQLSLVALMLLASFAAGALADRRGLLPGSIIPERPQVAETFSVFWQAWDLIEQHYVDRSAIEPRTMTYGAIDGLLNALGDTGHSRFLTPTDLKAEEAALSGQLEGIGAEVSMRDGRPTVVAPIEGSPAQKAGLKPGDVIVRVDGQDTSGQSLEQVVNRVRGAPGSSVTLTVVRTGQSALLDITIVRAHITVPSVTWARLPGTPAAHLLIGQFAERTSDDLAKALVDARSAGATAIVLDLRNNPGGIRDEAIGVASQFLGSGNVLIEQDAQGNRTPYPVRSGGVALDVPLVLLVNEGSASSAEIVAGALQDYQRAQLFGAKTFGTGTVLTPYPLRDGSALFLGTAEWFTPNGRQIWHHGITPDQVVTQPNGAIQLTPSQEGSLSVQQLQISSDAQLLAALQSVSQLAVR